MPYRARGRGRAAGTRPDTRATFEAARAALERGTSGADGLGFVNGEGVAGAAAGTDDDACRNERGDLTPKAAAIISQTTTYTEVSPGGEGVRFWATTAPTPARASAATAWS